MSNLRLRVLVSAYACEPGAGSEPGVGWNFVSALAERHEVWVLTRVNNRPAIESQLSRQANPRLHFLYFDLPDWQRWWKRGSRGIRTYYWLWQRRVPPEVRVLLDEVRFDLAHHITFVQYWSPSLLRDAGIPYVWGPVGGGEFFPRELLSALTIKARATLMIKAAVRRVCEKTRGVRRTAQGCRAALATTPETAARLAKLQAPSIRICSAAALSSNDLMQIGGNEVGQTHAAARFVCVSRLNGRKGEALGIRSFAAAAIAGSTYEVFGDGPERGHLEQIARSEGVENQVTFFGSVPRDELLSRLVGASALVHLSPEESGSFICLEAMAARVPPIVLQAGGPARLVPPDAGFRLPITDPESLIRATADKMRKLAGSPELRFRLGNAGRSHVERTGTWEAKINEIESVYLEILSSRPTDSLDGKDSSRVLTDLP